MNNVLTISYTNLHCTIQIPAAQLCHTITVMLAELTSLSYHILIVKWR